MVMKQRFKSNQLMNYELDVGLLLCESYSTLTFILLIKIDSRAIIHLLNSSALSHTPPPICQRPPPAAMPVHSLSIATRSARALVN